MAELTETRKKRAKHAYEAILSRLDFSGHKFSITYTPLEVYDKNMDYLSFKKWAATQLDNTSNQDFCHWLYSFFTAKIEDDQKTLKGLFEEHSLNVLSIFEEYEEANKKMTEKIEEDEKKLKQIEELKAQHKQIMRSLMGWQVDFNKIINEMDDDYKMLGAGLKGEESVFEDKPEEVEKPKKKMPRPL